MTHLHNVPWNTLSDYDAFGVLGPEYHGLDYESARDATPRWYGVSFGNGNDGVSHMWPNYYVRTDDPWTLAAAAMVGYMTDYRNHEIEIDGEADYTISAVIYNPPDDDSDDSFYIEAASGHIVESDEDGEATFSIGDEGYDTEGEAARAYCEENGIEPESWSSVNGAWIICEVFPIDDLEEEERPRYDSLADCFDEATLIAARAL